MPHCAAIGCAYSKTDSKERLVSLHHFPKEDKWRKKWINACGRVELPKDPRLCSRHFSPDAFESLGRARLVKELTGAAYRGIRLKPDALPTIFPHKELKRPRPRTASENRVAKRQRQETLDALLAVGDDTSQPAAATADVVAATADVVTTEGEPAIMEEDIPVQSEFQVSVTVQCSPGFADAETQTDIFTSDASIQFPTDVQEPVSRDHVYAHEPKVVLTRKKKEDVHSQDLFLSDEESEESESQPQTKSDSDYIVNSSEVSQSTQEVSQASSASHDEGRVFLVFEKQLKQLLQRCSKCGSLIDINDIRELQNEGSQLTLELTCAKSCTYRWQSQPSLSGTKGAGNLLLATSIFFSGIGFSKFDRFCSNMNLKTICEDTYMTLRKKFVFPVVEKTWLTEQSAVVATLKSQEELVELCGDGRCDSPGHSAKYCTYTFLDVQSQKVVDFKVISRPEVSSSNTMEIKGFRDALKSIEELGVTVNTISTDRHPQIVKEMREQNPEKQHQYDPWHVAKSLSKKLSAAAKRKECKGLDEWIQSIVNHFWWSAQTCENNAVVLKEKWMSVIHHVTNRHDWPGNRHYHQCAHEALDTDTQRKKIWLRPGCEAHSALVKIVKDKRLLKDLEHVTQCIHTTSLEVCSYASSFTSI